RACRSWSCMFSPHCPRVRRSTITEPAGRHIGRSRSRGIPGSSEVRSRTSLLNGLATPPTDFLVVSSGEVRRQAVALIAASSATNQGWKPTATGYTDGSGSQQVRVKGVVSGGRSQPRIGSHRRGTTCTCLCGAARSAAELLRCRLCFRRVAPAGGGRDGEAAVVDTSRAGGAL